MMFFYSIILSLVLGHLTCLTIFKEKKTTSFRLLFNLSLPIGIGFSSVLFIFFNLLKLPYLLIFIIEIAFIIFLLFKVKGVKTFKQTEWFSFNKPIRMHGSGRWSELFQNPILLLFTAIYFYAWLMDAGIFFLESIKEPHGLWDAFNYWNLKAKFISRAPSEWPRLFQQMISQDFHPDYPLLQTGYIARCWLYMKNEGVWVPIVFSFIFTFCTIGLLASSVSFFTNKTKGLIAGLILLATPFYMTMGDSQYADNTVGFFYLATIVLLTFARRWASVKPDFLIAAGFLAGLSAWSKNEGLLFITCLFCSQLVLLFFKNYRELLIELKYLLIGMLPILILIVYYKIAIAPPNDIVNAQGAQTFVKLTDYSRYKTVGKWFAEQFGTFGKWALNPWWFFLFGILYKGIHLKENWSSVISTFILLILMLTGFFLIYIITPLPLEFHLSTSTHRLFFQLFPSFIFIYFLALKDITPSRNKTA